MPWRLITFLVALALFVIFAGLNVGNQTDISFGFYTFQKIPIFISLFIAFLLGALVVLPFSIRRRKRPVKTDGSIKAIDEPKKKKKDGSALPDSETAVSLAEPEKDDRVIRESLDSSPVAAQEPAFKQQEKGRKTRRKKRAEAGEG